MSASGVGPHASTGVLVEVKAGGTFDFSGITLDTVEEHVTDGSIGVSEETVATGALVVGLRGLCNTNRRCKIFILIICIDIH